MIGSSVAFVLGPGVPPVRRTAGGGPLFYSRQNNRSFKTDSDLMELHNRRIATAGRKGTKRFVDPCNIYFSNLPFAATEEDVLEMIDKSVGHTSGVVSCKIVRDWKTGKSKGIAFVHFDEPVFATSALVRCKNRRIMGRLIQVAQGRKKRDPESEQLTKRKKLLMNRAVRDAELNYGIHDYDYEDEEKEKQNLGELVQLKNLEEDEDEDEDEDELYFDEDEYDGIYEQFYKDVYEPLSEDEKKMNRAKRRELSRRRKYKKLPHKGFGSGEPTKPQAP